ncbi:MAG: cysteine desulfurase-like protein, partial [Gemmatimonadetes bacterium]|nr:cysteine desulfurase-like protein [Gemmatimonadota bacterium]NIR38109.1 cysteine desulfurase-like protein [Actinomycetota bacterium]
MEGRPPGEAAEELARAGIFVWAGHYYAVEPMARLGLLDGGGLVR